VGQVVYAMWSVECGVRNFHSGFRIPNLAPRRVQGHEPYVVHGSELPRRSHGGFTLIEVVLVAIVLAILLTATVPRFQQAAQRLHTEQTAVDLMQLLRYAHELTVAQGEAIAWVWDSDTRQARLARVADVGRQWLTEPQARSRAIDDEISIEGTQDVDAVTFFPDGTSEPATLHVASGRNAYILTVDAATSQVALSAGPAP